ncbi:MAG: caspase family protein [Phormidesmis sp.]
MTRKLYALLVGINQYDEQSHVPHLQGCINDIHGMQSYLEGRVAQADFALNLQTLTNEQATRQGIIDGFQQHLAQAGPEDVVLFYYAGHGAQALAPEAFWPVSPDRMLETLVCYDSRTDNDHWDLADKELAQLIADVDRNNPHIVVVLDCCHSGSGTREIEAPVATRRAEPDMRQRPLESFIVSPLEAEALIGETTRSVSSPMAMKMPAVGRHVVLSACADIEEAKEYLGAKQPQGAFSYFLQSSLAKANGPLSYRDLFKRTNALIRNSVPAQSPQLDATHIEDLEQPFLGGAIAQSPAYFTVSYHLDHGWVIDGGAIHGLQAPTGSETTAIALFPFDAIADQLKDVSSAIAQVTITQVLPQLSKLEDSDPALADTTNTFKAVVISSPLPPLQVFLEGEAAGIAALQRAIASAGPNGGPSLYVQATEQANGAAYRVLVADNAYVITALSGDRPLVAPVSGYDTTSAFKVAKDLEHIARWKTIAELASPANSQIRGAIKLKIYTGTEPNCEDATEITDAQMRLDYVYNNAKQSWAPPRFRIKLHNTSDQTLHCALFYLTERFKVDSIKLDGVGSTVRLSPNEETWYGNGAALAGTVADALTECRDILKLIACTDEFDPTLMTLSELGGPPPVTTRSVAIGGGSLNRLMQRVNTRDIVSADAAPSYDDWVANQIAFTFVRPQLSTPLNPAQTVAVGANVRIHPHSNLGANVRLTTVSQSTRDLGSFILPPLLQNESEPFQFTQSRASDPGLSALELSNVSNPEAVTPTQPLRIETAMTLDEGEYVLPIAYDGEFYLPLGYGKTSGNKTEIVIERLTEPVSEGTRSMQGSIRIFFQKIAIKKLGNRLSQRLGITFDYPLLAVAELENTSAAKAKVTYLHNAEEVKAKVAKAKNIALYIHGIFGDTESMLPSLETAIAAIEDESRPIGQLYDLVLTFDYENLNTTIDQNACLLKNRLEAVGLSAGHDKNLHIIAHSMGGLVSRWFIEKEGGNQMVNHLIMLGTPNDGSPWPQVQAGVTAAVSFALNSLSVVAAPLTILDGLLKRIETLDVSLDQMEPGSEFLAEMAIAPDPGIPYTLVVGNTSLIEPDEKASLKQRLMRKLGQTIEMPFLHQPNDIAVLVDSITAVPAGRSPAPIELPVACNHLEYFTNPIGLAALSEAVIGAGMLAAEGRSQPAPKPEPSLPMVGGRTAIPPRSGPAIAPEPVLSEPILPAPLQEESIPAETPALETPVLEVPEPSQAIPSEPTDAIAAAPPTASAAANEPTLPPKFQPLATASRETGSTHDGAMDDEPSPFISERLQSNEFETDRSSSNAWIWILGAIAAALLIFGLAQRSSSPPPEPQIVEPES